MVYPQISLKNNPYFYLIFLPDIAWFNGFEGAGCRKGGTLWGPQGGGAIPDA